MKIISPSVSLISVTPNAERVIECCGRVCYQSSSDIANATRFIEMLIEKGHESVLEHASAGFKIVTDRGVTHEIVRHRLASYSQESTRWCNYSKNAFGNEITVIQPPDLDKYGCFDEWRSGILKCEKSYLAMLKQGAPPEIARSVLPNCLKSEICMTANFREWRHFLRLRMALNAHPQMRQIAQMIRLDLMQISRASFEHLDGA